MLKGNRPYNHMPHIISASLPLQLWALWLSASKVHRPKVGDSGIPIRSKRLARRSEAASRLLETSGIQAATCSNATNTKTPCQSHSTTILGAGSSCQRLGGHGCICVSQQRVSPAAATKTQKSQAWKLDDSVARKKAGGSRSKENGKGNVMMTDDEWWYW